MEFGPIWRALSRNKLRFGLIAGQIAITLAIVANCVTLIVQAREKMSERTGLDEERLVAGILSVPKTKFRDTMQREVWYNQNLDELRTIPGVQSLTGSGRWLWDGGFVGYLVKPANTTGDLMEVGWWGVDEFFPETVGAVLDEGRWFTGDEVRQRNQLYYEEENKRDRLPNGKMRETHVNNVVITRALGRHLFGDGPLVGKLLEDFDGDIGRVIGVIRDLHMPHMVHAKDHMVFLAGVSHTYTWGARFLVRTEPGQTEDMARRINDHLQSRYELSFTPAYPVAAVREAYFGPQRQLFALMGLLVFLLLFVASVGIAGLTSFSVTARTRQIGVRRALGATTNDILRHFLAESGLLITFGITVGAALAVPLNMGLLKFYDGAKLSPAILGACALLLFLVALGAAFPPARRASRISPAIATRNV